MLKISELSESQFELIKKENPEIKVALSKVGKEPSFFALYQDGKLIQLNRFDSIYEK